MRLHRLVQIVITAFALAILTVVVVQVDKAQNPGPPTIVSTAPSIQATQNQLTNWRLAKAKTALGIADTRVLLVGDSTTWGEGVTNWPTSSPATGSWPTRLANLINAINPTFSAQAEGGGSYASASADVQFTLTGGWITNGGFGFAQASFKTTSAGTLTYTPVGGYTLDTCDIYSVTSPGSGSMTAQMTGGASTPINLASANGINLTTITGTPGTSQVVTITQVSGTIFGVSYIDCYSSATHKIRFANAAVPGTAAVTWQNNAAVFNSIPMLKKYSPDLTIIMLGINDAAAGESAATYTGYLQTIITAAQSVNSSVIICTIFPSQNADPYIAQYALEQTYQNPTAGLTAVNNIPLIDIWGRYGGLYNASLYFNQLHPNSYGYFDTAVAMYPILFGQ